MRSKTIKTLSSTLIIALVFSVVPLAGNAEAQSKRSAKIQNHDQCMNVLRKYDSVSQLRKIAGNQVKHKLEGLNKLKKKVAERNDRQLPSETREILNNGIKSDQEKINQISGNASTTTDVRVLQKDICDVIFKIYRGRAYQVAYTVAYSTVQNVNNNVMNVLEHPANKNIDNRLKDEAEARLNQARDLVRKSDESTNEALKLLLHSKGAGQEEDRVSREGFRSLITDLKRVVYLHTESWAIRAVDRRVNPDLEISSIESVKLSDEKGNPVSRKETGQSAREASINVKVSGNRNVQPVIVKRSSNIASWR